MNTAPTRQISISNQMILAIFAAMITAFAFVALITNMIVSSKVNALAQTLSMQQSADLNNPVTVGATAQTNALSCQVPASASADDGTATGTQANALPYSTGMQLPMYYGNFSQSNNSTTNVSTSNTYVKDSYNTTKNHSTNVLITNNGNDYSDHRNSGNTTNTTVTTDNSNNSVNNSGNTTKTDNSNSSTNIQDLSNNSTNDSGNTVSNTTNTNTNTDNSVNTNVAAAIIL